MTVTVITYPQLLMMVLVVLVALLVYLYRDSFADLALLDRLSPRETREPPDLAIVGYDDEVKRRVEIALTLAGRDLLGNPNLSWADVQNIITWDQVLAYLEDLDQRVSALEAHPPSGGLAPP